MGRFLNVGGVFVDVSLGCPDIRRGWRERERGGGWGGRGGGGGRMGLVLRKVGLVYADFLYRFAGRRFVASIEIDADYTDADSNLQSPRMTDLVEEVCSFLFYF